MASKKVEMYAKKRYELDEIKNKIKEEFDKSKFSDMLSEYQGYQSADIIATGGKEAFFSFGAEGDFAKFGEDALKNLGFQGKVR